MENKLFKIRNRVRILTPLYISICAALLLDIKSNIIFDCSSILSLCGLIFFGFACVISNKLSNRCNDCERIYDIKIDNYDKNSDIKEEPDLQAIYEKREARFDNIPKTRLFQYYGVSWFGFIGLFFVVMSYFPSKNQVQNSDNQNIMLQCQVDSLIIINKKQVLQILDLTHKNDSILKSNIQYSNRSILTTRK